MATGDDPLEGSEFIVLEFDPRNADVSVLASARGGMKCTTYTSINRDTAVQDSRDAVGRARSQGLPLRYAVVRITTEEVFPPTT
jgi:hypothetical protein